MSITDYRCRWISRIIFIMASLFINNVTAKPAQIATSAIKPSTNTPVSIKQIRKAFGKQGIRISKEEAKQIKPKVKDALSEALAHGIGNSKVDFISIEIAQALDLDTGLGSKTVHHISAAIQYIMKHSAKEPKAPLAWKKYYDNTLSLNDNQGFLSLVNQEGFSPVKISWEDIGRSQNSAWGDRISDVGIWVRETESDAESARLALSVRRDQNYRDKVLVVPSDRIKIHRSKNGETQELTLTKRLKELKLFSKKRDNNVIVSNQFAIVPVPAHDMQGAWKKGKAPRAAFNFSIYPYGSTNYVITDVIEGSSEAIVGPGNHQYLYYNVNGKKAPFTASRAEDRPDLLELEAKLKAQGMDVDVQRYYLIQIPLKRGIKIKTSNMGTPNLSRGFSPILKMEDSNDGSIMMGLGGLGTVGSGTGGGGNGYGKGSLKKTYAKPKSMPKPSAPAKKVPVPNKSQPQADFPEQDELDKESTEDSTDATDATAGLTKVAIGHGEEEGSYFGGSGYRGNRSDEPIRVTIVYFVTPVGEVTQKDMDTFTAAFKKWDSQAIWGGSFVTKESW